MCLSWGIKKMRMKKMDTYDPEKTNGIMLNIEIMERLYAEPILEMNNNRNAISIILRG